jgi:hypothetical protein
MKIVAALAGLLILGGCTAAAEDAPTKAATPAYGPGWRHEQMMKAWNNGQTPPAMMAMLGQGQGQGPGFGMGRGGPPQKADGTIDPSQLPAWCPMRTAPQQQ